MNLIKFLFRSSFQLMIAALAIGFLSGSSSAGLIALISYAVAHFSKNLPLSLILGFAGLALSALLTSWLVRVILIKLSQEAVFQLQMNLSRQILASELTYLEKTGSSQLLAALTDDIQAIADAVYILPFLCINLAIITGCFAYIAWLSWQVFLIVSSLSFLTIFAFRFLLRRGRKLLTLAREDRDYLFQDFRTLTEGIKELKLHEQKRQDFLQEDLQINASRFRHHSTEGLSLLAFTDSVGKFVFFFAIGLVLFIIPKFIVLSPLALSSYVLTYTYLLGPFENIVNKLPIITKADVALQKLKMLGLSLSSHAEQLKPTQNYHLSWQQLKLQNVTHIYLGEIEDIHFTLGPINLEFKPGEIVFIIGGNGSGKSTLAKLITGLYTPECGEIWLDKIIIDASQREWYRQHFSVIFSDFYLFNRLLGLDAEKLNEQTQYYLKLLKLEHKITINQGRFSTTSLSQGQRKRLALLTAYLEDRPIYLFDEWAADQDPSFKNIFYTEFLPQLKAQGKLILAITHDDHYFSVADRIIKLNSGQIESDQQIVNKIAKA
ncbi:ABC transporter ATP-binding protein [Aphanothece hegewaldii CCALA 016]|uniref:ABC transporter ATP-binding protein n=1 Tax=Aphanothece hegewaldii CCALA 016 TaxID=2107694 RepID=A0A2T1M3K8_9CHRO|nr:cyclic peptide export ABC transporter [Aphanothece hegewaldii]PSF39427.1 ABC transporter ATP-binding protein [Aphanothece hegewaldii CCALA 016]